MKRINYGKYTGEDFGIDAEDLMRALADFLLQSGFRTRGYDDFTPMDFVILVLKKFFMKTDPEASKVMLQVHTEGAGLAGVYTFEVAETKVYSVNEFSRRQKHPLKCTMEKE